MLTKTLAATAALSMLVAGGSALAAQKTSATAAGPKAPVPYDQLNAYLKASPKARASKDWWAGSASTGQATTGMSADTAATAPATAGAPAAAWSSTSMSSPSTSSDSAVNPAPTAAPPSLPMTPPTNAPQPGDPAMPSQPATPPTEPK